MSRREFLLSVCGAATTLLVLDACTREAVRTASPGATPGGGYSISPEATTEQEVAHEAIGGEEFVFDIQGHLLEYDLNPILNGQDFWQRFPQQGCGEDDPRVCYSIESFLELMFLRSDTSMLVLSALPIDPEGSPMSAEVMDETRKIVEGLCRDERVLLHEVNLVVYHSGFEAGGTEGPYSAATANVGVNRLITSMKRAGVGPNENVYAELGSTWWYVMRYPVQAAHVLGKLLEYVGENNVLWGTDCLFYGSPQDQIQALRSFKISEEFQERYGYPELTRAIKT